MPHYKIVETNDPYAHVIANRAVNLAVTKLGIAPPRFNFVAGTIRSLCDLTSNQETMV